MSASPTHPERPGERGPQPTSTPCALFSPKAATVLCILCRPGDMFLPFLSFSPSHNSSNQRFSPTIFCPVATHTKKQRKHSVLICFFVPLSYL